MAGTIGIRIANGDFYPIIEENSPEKKRLVLTTAHDKQGSVQIDLFRSISKSMLDAQYIGCIVVENINRKPKGEPSIEMVISSDKNGNITAEAYNIDTGSIGERHTLNVSLHTLDFPVQNDDFLDFDFDNEPKSFGMYDTSEKEEERKFPWLIMGLATLFVAILIAGAWFFFLGGRDMFFSGRERSSYQGPVSRQPYEPPSIIEQPDASRPGQAGTSSIADTAQPVAAPSGAAASTAVPVQPGETAPPVIRAPASAPPVRPQTAVRIRPPAPVLSFRVPAVIPRNGVVYQIQWGDTLWDISQAFYRDPWLYPRIARHNNISNPDLIIAGSNVRIPPRN
jgi:LysM repeat protein